MINKTIGLKIENSLFFTVLIFQNLMIKMIKHVITVSSNACWPKKIFSYKVESEKLGCKLVNKTTNFIYSTWWYLEHLEEWNH